MKEHSGHETLRGVREASHDQPDEPSTERQEADCRKLAEARNWEVLVVYKDLQSA